jgi:hypothetical protein
MNFFLCLISIIAVQQLPMAFAGGGSARHVKGTRGGASSFSVRKLDSDELPSADLEDSGPGTKKNRVKGPSKRDCKMCKFHSNSTLFGYSVSVFFVA